MDRNYKKLNGLTPQFADDIVLTQEVFYVNYKLRLYLPHILRNVQKHVEILCFIFIAVKNVRY